MSGRRGQRTAAVAVALVVAAAGIGFVIVSFQGGEPFRAADGVTNGVIAFATESQIFKVNPNGTGLAALTDLTTSQAQPAWSPDGSTIAFVAQGAGGEMRIAVMDADGSNIRTLTRGPGSNFLPTWAPNGSQIAFVSNRDGNDEIYVMNADGSAPTRLTHDPEEDFSPSWSTDGTRIAFQSNREGFNRIYGMHPDGSNVTRLTEGEGFDPAWSPDGDRLAFVRTTDGNPEIYVAKSDGSNERNLTIDPSHDWSPAWSPDGSFVAFESDRGGRVGIWVMRADGTDIHQLVDTGSEACCPAWQPLSGNEATPTPTTTATPIPTPSPVHPRITARIEVGDFPNAVAVGEGSVWVSVPNNDGSGTGQILRIDPGTNDIVARIPVPAIPTWETGGGGLAVGARGVWIAALARARDLGDEAVDGGQAGLLRIDPSTNRVVDAIPLGGESGADVAVTEDAAWALVFSGPNEMSVLRVDLATNQIAATIPVPGVWGQEIFGTSQGIFVNTRDPFPGEDSTVGASRLTMIDPATNQIRWTLPDTRFVESFVPDGLVWAQGGGTKYANVGGEVLVRLDPATGDAIGEPIDVARYGQAFVVAPDGGVWFSGSGRNGWTIERFNITTGTADAEVDTGEYTQDNRWWPVAVAFDSAANAIWHVHYRDYLTRIDLR